MRFNLAAIADACILAIFFVTSHARTRKDAIQCVAGVLPKEATWQWVLLIHCRHGTRRRLGHFGHVIPVDLLNRITGAVVARIAVTAEEVLAYDDGRTVVVLLRGVCFCARMAGIHCADGQTQKETLPSTR